MALNEYSNAIIGILCDLKKDQKSSITYKIKMKGYSLEAAFKKVLQEFEEEMNEFLYAQSALMAAFPNSEELEKTMDLMERQVDSVSYLMMYTFRYGNIQYAFVK